MPATKLQPTQRSPAARKILSVATDLFHRRGYDATGVQEIVSKARLTKGAFYHHFESKNDVLRTIHEDYLDRELARLEEIHDSDLEPAAKLSRVIEMVVGTLPEHRKSMSVFIRERRALTPANFKRLKRKRDRYEEMLTEVIATGVKSGDLADVGDPKLIGFGILGMCVWGNEWFDPSGSASAEEIADLYSSVVLKGLLATGHPGRR